MALHVKGTLEFKGWNKPILNVDTKEEGKVDIMPELKKLVDFVYDKSPLPRASADRAVGGFEKSIEKFAGKHVEIEIRDDGYFSIQEVPELQAA